MMWQMLNSAGRKTSRPSRPTALLVRKPAGARPADAMQPGYIRLMYISAYMQEMIF